MVIRMRHTRAHSGNRRSHHALKEGAIATCSHCGATRRPHHMCLECGYYNGRQVIDLAKAKSERKARMDAKKELIKNELGVTGETPAPASAPKEEVSKEK